VTSKESKTIRESMLAMELKAYFMRLHKWEENILQEICWEAIAQARKKNSDTMTIFTIKLTTSWLPVGSNELRQGTRCTDECPLCKTRETVPHLFQCPQRRKWQEAILEELSLELKKAGTKTSLKEEIIEGISAWLEGNESPHRSPQTRIGWFQLMLGYINMEWIREQEEYYRRTSADNKYFTGTTWGSKLITWLWTQAHIVWKHRCEVLHGKEGPSQKIQENLIAQVKNMYGQIDQLRAQDKILLEKPMEEVLEANQSTLQAYTQIMQPMIDKAVEDAKTHDTENTRDIREMWHNKTLNKPQKDKYNKDE
jgi:hypothetical protein